MKSKIRIYIYGILAFILMLGSIGVANTNKATIQTNSSAAYSNTKIEWGIKRGNNHEQPDLGSKNIELIERYSGMAMGNKESKNIYVTFDLGYEAGYTESILNTLKQNNVPATFFITAHYVNTASDLVQRMINDGHIIGNHTVNHKSMPEITEEEIKDEVMKLHQAVYEKFGYEMKYIRPPKGEFSERTIITTNNLGYTHVMWSFAYVDWDEKNQPDEEKAKKTILDNLHNGEIILLHANSKTNANILDSIIKEIKAQEYEIRSLDEFK